MLSRTAALRLVKMLHSIAWAFFAGCIVVIPLLALRGRLAASLAMIGVVAIEVVVLALNSWHCPLTPIAARFTEDRRANFDIYLPEWLARWNKQIFGTLYILGVLATMLAWLLSD